MLLKILKIYAILLKFMFSILRSELPNKPNCRNISVCVDQRGFL
jgi:hypothetical protein